jgi:SAM-dependent MidA family methyltransferase
LEEADDRELRRLILERICEKGRLTFAEYMAACLYEPGLGYYTSPGTRIGASGDFYTSSNVHGVFGRLIAREIIRMWGAMDSPSLFEIVEVGAGNGRLALDILDAISDLRPKLYDNLLYRLVEAEPTLREVQADLLNRHLARCAWSPPAVFSEGGLNFSGCLLSNELIDSFPVHLVEMTDGGLREIYVTELDDDFGEELGPPSTPELERYLARSGVALLPGQRVEINLAAGYWLSGVAAALERGFVLTIDYGYPAAELYAPYRKNGTLLCYYRHRVEENPFIRVGRQDMTSHVDFTNLISAGSELGLEMVWFGEQYRFLMAAGLMDEMAAAEAETATEEEKRNLRLILKKLILPDGGMGDTFKVLIQSKGVKEPRLLCLREWARGL